MTFRADFAAGARAMVPLLPAGATVGLVTGVAATAVGLSGIETAAMSVAVYSPTVMLTAVRLLGEGAPTAVLVFASLVVGVRFAVLSLSIAPHFDRVATRWKWLLAYFLLTPTYALSIERFEADPGTDRRAYYLGTALPLWVAFQAALLVGVAFGARVPARWDLGFVLPLAFVALLARILKDRPTTGAALVAGVVAVFAAGLPLNVGVVVATASGTAAGVLLGRGGVR